MVFQRFHGAGDGQIGLAGARRADAEVQIALADGVDVAPLIGAPRLDAALARTHHRRALAGAVGRRGKQFLDAGFLQEEMHRAGVQSSFLAGLDVQPRQQRAAGAHPMLRAGQAEGVAAIVDADAQPPFEMLEVLVERAAQCSQTA